MMWFEGIWVFGYFIGYSYIYYVDGIVLYIFETYEVVMFCLFWYSIFILEGGR